MKGNIFNTSELTCNDWNSRSLSYSLLCCDDIVRANGGDHIADKASCHLTKKPKLSNGGDKGHWDHRYYSTSYTI